MAKYMNLVNMLNMLKKIMSLNSDLSTILNLQYLEKIFKEDTG